MVYKNLYDGENPNRRIVWAMVIKVYNHGPVFLESLQGGCRLQPKLFHRLQIQKNTFVIGPKLIRVNPSDVHIKTILSTQTVIVSLIHLCCNFH